MKNLTKTIFTIAALFLSLTSCTKKDPKPDYEKEIAKNNNENFDLTAGVQDGKTYLTGTIVIEEWMNTKFTIQVLKQKAASDYIIKYGSENERVVISEYQDVQFSQSINGPVNLKYIGQSGQQNKYSFLVELKPTDLQVSGEGLNAVVGIRFLSLNGIDKIKYTFLKR